MRQNTIANSPTGHPEAACVWSGVLRGLAFALLCAIVLALASASSCTSNVTLTPTSYVTTSGGSGGEPVANLDLLDETGIASNPSSYVEFKAKSAGAPYAGYRTYFLPGSIKPDTIVSIQVQANFLGPLKSTQIWTWQIFDWAHNGFVSIGDNYIAPPHGPWTILTFNLSGNNLSNYVRPSDGQIRIGLVSNNTADDALLDYEALVVTSDPANPPPGPSFYVATTGNDSNPGTITSPWQHLSKAAATVNAGATVYVRGGVYHERLIPANSGSATAGYIQFQSYPGETAIIDGTGVTMPPVVTTPTGLVQINNLNYIVIEGFEIRNFVSNDPNLFPAGISIAGAGHAIRIVRNRIHNISNGVNGAHGLGVYGTAAPEPIYDLTIDGNELFDLTLGQSESMALNGNVQSWRVINNSVHDNDNIGIDAVGFEGTSPQVAYDQARDGDIAGNLVYNINDNANPAYPPGDNSAGGIYVDGGAGITIERNVLHHNNIGIEAASEHLGRASSNVTVRNNLVYLDTGPGLSIGGYSTPCAKCDASSGTCLACVGSPCTVGMPCDCCGSTDHCSIVNNTLFHNDGLQTGSGELQVQYFPGNGSASNNIVENNIFSANSQGVLISDAFTNPIAKLDYNLYFAPNGDPTNNNWQWDTINYSTYASYQAGSKNDLDSPFGDPQFLSLSLPNLWVSATSPALDAGTNLAPGIVGTVDLAGFDRLLGGVIDIGAYQQ
jgi:hypothetical protein